MAKEENKGMMDYWIIECYDDKPKSRPRDGETGLNVLLGSAILVASKR
ncbi:MAG: hypothetical protein QME25_02270 [Bacteroidota bacterium]|nr:hypothetical protein [Bacteroidota bacterium]